MGKTLKYVKDFDFNVKPCNYAYGGGVFDGVGAARGAAKLADKVKNARAGNAMQKVRRDIDRNEIPRQRKFDDTQRQKNQAQIPPPAPPAPTVSPDASVPPAPQGVQPPMLNPTAAMRGAVGAAARPFKKGGQVKMAGGGCYSKGGKAKAGAAKMSKVMGEYKSGKLHSGSKSGPVVKNRKQAVAIAMSEARKSKR